MRWLGIAGGWLRCRSHPTQSPDGTTAEQRGGHPSDAPPPSENPNPREEVRTLETSETRSRRRWGRAKRAAAGVGGLTGIVYYSLPPELRDAIVQYLLNR